MKLIDKPHCKKHEIYEQKCIGCRIKFKNALDTAPPLSINPDDMNGLYMNGNPLIERMKTPHTAHDLVTRCPKAKKRPVKSAQYNRAQAFTESHTQLRSRRHPPKLTEGRRDYHRAIPMSIYEKIALCTIIYIVMLFIMAQITGPKLQRNRSNDTAVVVAFAIPLIITVCIGVLL
jgi:hypothetical protein